MSRQFQINRRPFNFTYDIINNAGTPVYRVKIGTVAGTGPDLTLYDGPDETAVLAVCHFPRFSLDYKIALGDPAAPETQWEDMVKITVGGGQHRLSVTLSHDERFSREGHGQRREFVWKRTRHEAVEGGSVRKASLRNWKLVEGDAVRAVFNDAAGAGVCGTLQIQEDRGRDLDVMVVITLLALYERRRRA